MTSSKQIDKLNALASVLDKHREVSIQEAIYRLLGLQMTKSSVKVKYLSTVHPHHRDGLLRGNLEQLDADAIICSAYKFFGPHIGVMAHKHRSFDHLQPAKVGLRFGEEGLVEKDVLDPGAEPTLDNCEISRWENGTNNYEGL